ncbi:MAG: DUF2877 domain-containing protein [Chloroflexota bacterium]|nr:DUF2877 domain-containing protein [Chloroflexota bacterium]
MIHSVFDRALNLQLGDGELVGLVGRDAGNGPSTVVLAAQPVPGFPSIGLTPGQSWSITPGRLVLGATPIGGALVFVDLSTVRLWCTALELRRRGVCATDVSADEVLVRLRRVEELASAVAPIGGLAALLPFVRSLVAECAGDAGPATYPLDRAIGQTAITSVGPGTVPALPDPITHRALMAAAELVRGWRVGDRQLVQTAATRLSGLGPGLTPSGDDLLAGFLVGVQRVGHRAKPVLGVAVVVATRGTTTDIAIARVRHAANGLIEERLEDVLAAVLIGDGTDLESAVRRAATWGHTSGVDTLVGLCLGLRLGLHDVSPTSPQ